MKKLLLLIVCLSVFHLVSAQVTMPKNENGEVEYKQVVEVKASKDELYNRTKLWFNSAFKNPKEVIQMDEKASGIISGVGGGTFMQKDNSANGESAINIKFKVTFELKDNKYRYTFSNISEEVSRGSLPIENIIKLMEQENKESEVYHFCADTIKQTDTLIKGLEASLRSALSKSNDF